MSLQSFFNKISQVSTNELIEFMDHNKTEVTLKLLHQYVKANIHSKKNDKHLSLFKFSSYQFSNEPVTCLFQIKDDRYFFKSHINSTNSDYTLDIPGEIFQLQRRNDYRATTPIGVTYNCEVKKINGVKADIKTEIRDFSLGGCQISIPGITLDIKKDDEFEIHLKLDKFEFQRLVLTAKHVKPIDTQNSTLIGASLIEPESEVLADLQSMLMYLDRVHRGKTD